jgi:hypothetical protein
MIPGIASEGIQESDVTDDSMRMDQTLLRSFACLRIAATFSTVDPAYL